MATNTLPDVKQKQKLLFAEEIQPAALSAQAEQFSKVGWYNDAIDFFARAGDRAGLERMRERALEEGDVFLFLRCLRALAAEATDDEWHSLGECARKLEKWQFAREAFRRAGDRKAMEAVEALIAPVAAQATAEEPEPENESESESESEPEPEPES